MIDCWDRKQWFPATIIEKKEVKVNCLIYFEYRVSFRVYPEKLENWENFKTVWPEKRTTKKDANGVKYFGDDRGFDEYINSFSNRIQKFNTFLNSNTTDLDAINYSLDSQINVKFIF